MLESLSVEIVRIDQALLRQALSDYAKYADKSWGLVDCASFIVMRKRGITEAFTSDIHFEQAGFSRLLTV
jgi:predicted nucleic acid-binding protein